VKRNEFDFLHVVNDHASFSNLNYQSTKIVNPSRYAIAPILLAVVALVSLFFWPFKQLGGAPLFFDLCETPNPFVLCIINGTPTDATAALNHYPPICWRLPGYCIWPWRMTAPTFLFPSDAGISVYGPPNAVRDCPFEALECDAGRETQAHILPYGHVGLYIQVETLHMPLVTPLHKPISMQIVR
jgi:hypothetical protein